MGTTIVGRATIVEPELDNQALWKMWLQYTGERGMIEFHKRKLLKGIKACQIEL